MLQSHKRKKRSLNLLSICFQFAFSSLRLRPARHVASRGPTHVSFLFLRNVKCMENALKGFEMPWNLLKRLKKTWDPSFRVPLSTKLRSVLLVAKSSWRSSLCRSFSFMRSSAAKAPLSQQMTAAAFFFSFFTWIHTYSYCFLLYLSNYQLINWIIY